MRAFLPVAAFVFASAGFGADWDREIVSVKELRELAQRIPATVKSPVVVVQDRGVYVFKKRGKTYVMNQYAMKVNNRQAIREGVADVTFEYNSYYQKLAFTRAETICPDGKTIPVAQGDFHESRMDEGDAVYSNTKTVKFSFPSASEGCILNYVYVTEEVRDVMPGHFSGTWMYWTGAPVLESTMVLDYPESEPFSVRHFRHGAKSTESASGGRVRKEWRVTRLETVDDEAYMPKLPDLVPESQFTNARDWADIAKWYWKLAMPIAKLDPDAKEAIATAIEGEKAPREKAEAIWKWVTKNLRYVSTSLGESSHRPHTPNEVFLKRYGDCKDQSLFLVAAMRAFGIDAYLALLSAGDTTAFDKELPCVNRFDHCIAMAEIEGKRYWLDATDGLTPFGSISEAELGVPVLLVTEAGGEIVRLPKVDAYSAKDQNLTLKVDVRPDNTCDVSMQTSIFGSLADQLSDVKDHSELDDAFRASLKKVYPTARDIQVTYKRDEKASGMTITAAGHAQRAGEMLGDMLLLNTLNEAGADRPEADFLGEDGERRYPFVFTEDGTQTIRFEVSIPDGWVIDECFKPFELRGPGQRAKRTVNATASKIEIVVELAHIEEELPPTALDQVLKFEKDLVAARQGRIVLKKRT